MIDAEQAEVLARAAAEKADARAREEALARAREDASAAAARQQARREAAEQARIRWEETKRRRAQTLFARAATPEPEVDTSPVEETLQRATVTTVGAPAVEELAKGNGRPDPREEARARKALVKADKLAAKQAARQMAALEKKEARERKALAKAAARRKTV